MLPGNLRYRRDDRRDDTSAGYRPAQLLAIAFLALAMAPSGADLTRGTLAAFERYVSLTEARMAGEMSGASPFLWIDRQATDGGRCSRS